MKLSKIFKNNHKKPTKETGFWRNVDTCEYCGGNEFSSYLNSIKPTWYKKEPLIIKQCKNCLLGVASPRPNPEEIYSDYLKGEDTSQAAVKRKLSRPNVMVQHTNAVKKQLIFTMGNLKHFLTWVAEQVPFWNLLKNWA